MVNLSRRGLLGMMAAGVGAAIVRPGLLMPVKPGLIVPVSGTSVVFTGRKLGAYQIYDLLMPGLRHIRSQYETISPQWAEVFARA